MVTKNEMLNNYSKLHPRDFDLRFPYTDEISKKETSLPKVKVRSRIKNVQNHHITIDTIHSKEDWYDKENRQISSSTLHENSSKDSNRKNAKEKSIGANKTKKTKKNSPVETHQECPECGLLYDKKIIEVHLSQCSIIRENEVILPKIRRPKMIKQQNQYKHAEKNSIKLQGQRPWTSAFLIGHTKTSNVRICSASSKFINKQKDTSYNLNCTNSPDHQTQRTTTNTKINSKPQYCRMKGNWNNLTGKNGHESDRRPNRKGASSENGIYSATKSAFRRIKINEEYSWKRRLYEIYELSWKQFEKMVQTCNDTHKMRISSQKIKITNNCTLTSNHVSKLPPQMQISLSDIPFPPLDQLDGLELIGIFPQNEKNNSQNSLDGYNVTEVRRLLRNAMMRWYV